MCRRFLIWNKEEEGLAVAATKGLPNSFNLNGTTYQEMDQYFADFDHLRDDRRQLIGFSFITDGNEAVYDSDLLESENVIVDGFRLVLMLTPSREYKIETIQGVGTRIFRAGSTVAIEVPDWDAEPLGFSFSEIEITSGEQ